METINWPTQESRQILVTGSSGFIGSWLCRFLKIPEDLQYDIKKSPEEDITKPETVKRIANSNATVLIHLAGLSGVKDCEDDSRRARCVNTKATLELARACKASGFKRFIFASTSSVYGETSQYVIDERHPTQPRCEYGLTKLKAERILDLSVKGFEVAILRKSNVYGYGTYWKGRTVIDAFIKQYIDQNPFRITGAGLQKRDFLHIHDAARLYAQIAKSKRVRSGIYNVGGGEVISIRALADLVNNIGESVLGWRCDIEEIPSNSKEASWHDFRYDYQKAQMEFQFKPALTLDDYIKERFLYEIRRST